MRATSLRRAPQRNDRDRTLGERAPLEPGACPHCFRVVSITRGGRRRAHRDAAGDLCTGSGVHVRDVTVALTELPPVVLPPERGRPPARTTPRAPRISRAEPWTRDGAPMPQTQTTTGERVRYQGGSDRIPATGRGVCPSCQRHIPLNTDGKIRRHRTRHQDPLAPYCDPL